VEQRGQKGVGIQVFVDRDPMTEPPAARRPMIPQLGPAGTRHDHVAGEPAVNGIDEIAAQRRQKRLQKFAGVRCGHGDCGL
jgi:hypothetical protein